jgi:hypothetical protein
VGCGEVEGATVAADYSGCSCESVTRVVAGCVSASLAVSVTCDIHARQKNIGVL